MVKSRVKSKRLQAQIPDYPLLQSPVVLILHSELQTKQTKQIISATANNFSLKEEDICPHQITVLVEQTTKGCWENISLTFNYFKNMQIYSFIAW